MQRARAGGFDYVLVGRQTGCVFFDEDRIESGSFRTLLAASERDQQRLGFTLRQTAWYLPRVSWVENPFDIGAACVSYLARHPKLQAAYVVAPLGGLIGMVLDVVRQRSSIDARLVSHPDEITPSLRAMEPELPMHWHRVSVYPAAGGRVSSSIMPSAPVSGDAAGYGAVPKAPSVPRIFSASSPAPLRDGRDGRDGRTDRPPRK